MSDPTAPSTRTIRYRFISASTVLWILRGTSSLVVRPESLRGETKP